MPIKRRTGRDGKWPSWRTWKREHVDVVSKASEPQRALLEATVRFVGETEGRATMVRFAAFFLLHAGMGLTPAQVGAAVGRTDRAMRTVQSLSAHELLISVWGEMGRHRKPKLSAEHAGPIALYLVEHPGCTQGEMVSFIKRSFDIQIDPLTLRRFFKTYGLGVLREDRREEGTDARPFVSGARASGGRSSSSPRRLR
jgi:hypothetical protein